MTVINPIIACLETRLNHSPYGLNFWSPGTLPQGRFPGRMEQEAQEADYVGELRLLRKGRGAAGPRRKQSPSEKVRPLA